MMMNLRTPITLVGLIALLIIGLLLGWRLATDDVPSLRDSTSSGPTCKSRELEAGSRIKARQITVNVLNAGSVPNLAGDTMRALTRKGFEGGTTGNAPKRVRARRVLIRDANPKSVQVRLVARQFSGSVQIRKAGKDDTVAVEVIVGNRFDPSDVNRKAPTTMKVRGTTDVCVPVDPDA